MRRPHFFARLGVVLLMGLGGCAAPSVTDTTLRRPEAPDSQDKDSSLRVFLAPSMDAAPVDPLQSEYARLHRLVTKLAGAARNIVVDGNADDWSEFPWYEATVYTETPNDPDAQKLSLAIAPLRDRIYFCLRGPEGDPRWLDRWKEVRITLELPSKEGERLVIYLRRSNHVLWVQHLGETENVKTQPETVRSTFAGSLEGVVLLEPLASSLPEPIGRRALDPLLVPWVRIITQLSEHEGPRPRDSRNLRPLLVGPTAASYRLDPVNFRPTWMNRRIRSSDSFCCPFFLDGKWFVSQGAFSWPTHGDSFSFDFERHDQRGCTNQGGTRSRAPNKFHYSWDLPVYAPSSGSTLKVIDFEPDLDVPDFHSDAPASHRRSNFANGLNVKTARFIWSVRHLRQHSVRQRRGDRVVQGDVIGFVGSSGSPTGPHIHLEIRDLQADDRLQAHLVLRVVNVSLNPHDYDPWQIQLAAWEPESGYYVESTAP